MENPTLPTNWLAATSWGLRVIPFPDVFFIENK